MRHPYRHGPAPARPTRDDLDDERGLALLLAAIGLVPVVVSLAAGDRFGAEPTIGLGLLAVAATTAWHRR